MTGLDLITSSMRLIGVLASGENPSSAEANDALEILQDLIDQWQAERLNVFTIQRIAVDVNGNPLALIPGQQAYTVGTNGSFNIPRPARIDRVGIINLANPIQPLELAIEVLDDAGWQAIPVKNIQSALPLKVWNDKGFPFMTLYYWAVPNVVVQTALYVWGLLSTFNDLNITELEFPPAYAKALRFNLAIDLAPEFGRDVPQIVAATAIQAKAIVKSMNSTTPIMGVDEALRGGGKRTYNWLTDEPVSGGR